MSGQITKVYVNRHRIERRPKSLGFLLFFRDKRSVRVNVFDDVEDLEIRVWELHGEKVDVEGFFFRSKDHFSTEFGEAGFALPRLDDSTVAHELTHACVLWMRDRGFAGDQVFDYNPDDSSPFEIFAEELGEMVQQFWECFTAAGRKRPNLWRTS